MRRRGATLQAPRLTVLKNPFNRQLTQPRTVEKQRQTFRDDLFENQSPIRRINELLHKDQQDSKLKEFLRFTMEDEAKQDAKSRLRKRERLKDKAEFEVYQRAIVYSREKGLKHTFDRKYRTGFVPISGQTKAISLTDIVGKKDCEEMIEKNSNIRNTQIAQEYLKDPQIREKTLKKALLFQRFFDIQRQQLSLSASSINNPEVPKRFKNINPRHMRIKTDGIYTEDQFRRKKYVETKTRLQYFQKALKVIEDDVDNRRRENSDLIDMLVGMNLNQKFEKPSYKDESRLLKRLYLNYSNHQADDPMELYTFIPEESLRQMAADFVPQVKYTDLQSIYVTMKPVNIYRLYEVLHLFCKIIFGSSKKQMVSRLLAERIVPGKNKFLDPIWIQMEAHKKQIQTLHKTDKGINEALKKMFYKGGRTQNLSFIELFQYLWDCGIFPNHMAKSKIKYFFEYCCLEGDGLCFQEFQELIDAVALYIYRDLSMKASQKVLHLYTTTQYFKVIV